MSYPLRKSANGKSKFLQTDTPPLIAIRFCGQARTELYRGQCNCPVSGTALSAASYLPHLRNAIYQHLIAAENLLIEAVGRHEPWVEAESQDFNFDGRPDVKLANDRLSCCFHLAAAVRCMSSTCAQSATICSLRSAGDQKRTIKKCWPDPTRRGAA